MDNARQVVRWSIPGFVFALELAMFAATSRLAEGRDPLGVINAMGPATAAIGLLAGVPVGFLLYQLYFRAHGPFGYSLLLAVRQRSWRLILRSRPFARMDRGAMILREYFDRGGLVDLVAYVWPRDDHSGRALTKNITETARTPMTCPDCRTRYEERFRQNWSTVMAMLDFTSGFPNACVIKSEYTNGSDIYHALGATRTAIAGAWYTSLGYLFIVARPVVGQLLLGALSISMLAFVQYKVLSSAREQAFRNLVARVATGLVWFSRGDWRPVRAASADVTAPRRR